MELTSQNVRDVMMHCLFKDEELVNEEPPAEHVLAEGILHTFALHPGRLEEKRKDVTSMLAQLEDEFFASKGGGMSFLRICTRRDGVQWGEHPTGELLMCLGLGLGLVSILAPRELWAVLPGGMPYCQVSDKVLE